MANSAQIVQIQGLQPFPFEDELDLLVCFRCLEPGGGLWLPRAEICGYREDEFHYISGPAVVRECKNCQVGWTSGLGGWQWSL